VKNWEVEAPATVLPPEFADDALALRFAERHVADLRFVATWGRWFKWSGTRWKPDETYHAMDHARLICREAAAECNKGKEAKGLASAKTVAAVVTLARADRKLVAVVDQWDRDPWMLNTPGGTFHLKRNEMLRHRPDDFITKITAVAPSGGCRLWMAFLERITGGDKQLQLYLQRMAGYMLTGDTSEHALFFGYGTGANGKGVFVNTISGVMGDYATTAPMETFIASNVDRHPTELAGLRGARLVTAQETEEGRRWAEAKIKALTGGDRISARFMRQDYFEFTPQFKLLIIGNHKPSLRNVDEAMRRRMNLIPFTVTIPEGERDEKLPEKLRAEWPGILQWMIDGCAEWQGEGLAKPEAVQKATDDYLAAEDAIAEWITECCMTGNNNTDAASTLFKSWSRWARDAGEFGGSQKRFSQSLEDRGYPKAHTRTGTRFQGLAAKPETDGFGYDER
jgi:putative DNA primase/helicase